MTPSAHRRLAIGVLSLIAGLADCLGWTLLHGSFTAHITGNLVVVAADAARGRSVPAATLLAIPAFILVTAAATLLSVRVRGELTVQRRLLSGQTVLLIAAAASGSGTATLLTAVCAMAVQNVLLHLLFSPAPSTAVMTGNVVAATIAVVRLAATRDDRPAAAAAFGNAWPLLAGFTIGCVAAGIAATALAGRAWLLPAAVSLATTAWLWNRTTNNSTIEGARHAADQH
ncbi:hypothetical protein Acy02nite_81690 [Actinoplanes cyaneus]|uniref:DUF1275 domain-containing protein n=1 Tax=Actinoplanes cyaneus TaxID=52696 RepID=A0A919IV61_9ACTN|nr:YoaK family protein [Actinoplanes cyaneus]MCW2143438.1 Uncharacterized membrane protein YoaK, UPF0700 family [Actinoplanes cyaneus]GID70288.1 hypothetical protein Acy02nite_81690 [Actinoplanes cyaneus]